MAERIRCGSPGSSQNGCSSSAGIGGRKRSPAKSSQCASQPSATRKRTNSFAVATCPPALKTTASAGPGQDGERLAIGAARPRDRGRVLVVVLRPRRPERVRDRQGGVRRHHHPLREERLVVAAVVPADRVGRGAALALDRGVAVERLDEPGPDLRLVDDQPAVAGHVVGPVGRQNWQKLDPRCRRRGRHRQADAPDVVAASGLAHGRLDLVAPEGPERPPTPWGCPRA